MDDLLGHSVSYRVALGPQAGRKVFTLQTIPAKDNANRGDKKLAKASGFSVHAGVAAQKICADEELKTHITETAYHTVLSAYSWKACSNHYVDIFRSLLSE